MPYPVFNIPFSQYLNYVNNLWIANGEGDITGVIGNNVVNALYQYILTCPLNYQKVAIVGQNTAYTATNAITYFFGGVPSSVSFGDNFWNEWVFINSTSSQIPFANGLGYYDVSNIFQNTIPAKSALRISKATNGQWVQSDSIGSSSSNTSYVYYNTITGAETDSLTNVAGNIFTVPLGAVQIVNISIWAVSNTDEKQTIEWLGQVDNTDGLITVIEQNRTSVGAAPFGELWWQSPDYGGSVLIAGDQSYKGVRVTITGLAGKILKCEAQFEFKTQSTF